MKVVRRLKTGKAAFLAEIAFCVKLMSTESIIIQPKKAISAKKLIDAGRCCRSEYGVGK